MLRSLQTHPPDSLRLRAAFLSKVTWLSRGGPARPRVDVCALEPQAVRGHGPSLPPRGDCGEPSDVAAV